MSEIAETHGSLWVRDRIIGLDICFVYLAKNRDPNLPSEIVVKSMPAFWASDLQFEKEFLCNLQSGPSSHVLRRCYGDEITTTKSGKKIYNILLEYCSGSTLYDHIGKFGPNGLPELEVRRYTRDIVHGLCYLHCNAGYIHCNINAKSILLSPTGTDGAMVARIANLDSAKELTSHVLKPDVRGSPVYMSPELVKEGYLDWPADVWALGLVVLEMLTGARLFTKLPCDADYRELPTIPNEISRAGKDFLKRCFVTSPYKRTPIWLLIKHPFVSLLNSQ